LFGQSLSRPSQATWRAFALEGVRPRQTGSSPEPGSWTPAFPVPGDKASCCKYRKE
jgi:hypothetical protein